MPYLGPKISRRPASPLTRWALVLSLGLLSGCGVRTASLRLEVPKREVLVRRSRVVVDDQELGSLAYVLRHGVAMPAGVHRVTVEADGYLPWDKEVVSTGSGVVPLVIELVKRPE